MHQVALIHLPDATPLARWRDMCQAMSQHAAEDGPARLVLPGGGVQAVITYPDLLGVRGPVWVYVAWRGVLAWRHAAVEVAPLHRDHLAGMDPLWANRMHVGQPYLWVDAAPEEVCHVRCPTPRHGGVVYGGTRRADPQAPPLWRNAAYRYVPTAAPA